MAFNVREILSSISQRGGLAKSSKFAANIVKAPVVLDEDLKFFCETASLPGIAFQTDEIRNSGYGNIEKRPYATIFQDVQLDFYCDNNGRVFNFFHQWLQSVYNFNDKTPLGGRTARGLIGNTFAYPKDYFGTITLTVYNEQKPDGENQEDGNPVVTYYLEEAYPINMGDVQVSWENSDQILKLPVTFAYTYWDSATLDPGTASNLSRTYADTLRGNQTRIDGNLRSIRERIGIDSPDSFDRENESPTIRRDPSSYR